MASCCICGRASPLDLGEIPECGTLEVEDWSEQLAYDGETNWLPCLDPETPEWDLVAGVYVGPGNEMSPRMWLFKHAASKSSPSGRQFWTFDEWVTQFKVDPFLQLYNRRMQTNPGWLSFFTRGRAKTLEDMHLRTRVIGIGKKR
ncbi:MAG TPA: hypothetical protein PLI05_07705 [Methanotrichaceae archaeon]|nr:hypothetical protein [Methanotrichaceae archaeon]HQI91501.1 hypothetical protein [Methanotrichaceae archaeon]HQJ28839.1 hypothetical protein [Methanotrichaceae archaeon]